MSVERADNAVASMTDQMVRSAIVEAFSQAAADAPPQADAGDMIESVFAGAVCAVARFIHPFRAGDQSHEAIADAVRLMVLSFLAQADANQHGGTA